MFAPPSLNLRLKATSLKEIVEQHGLSSDGFFFSGSEAKRLPLEVPARFRLTLADGSCVISGVGQIEKVSSRREKAVYQLSFDALELDSQRLLARLNLWSEVTSSFCPEEPTRRIDQKDLAELLTDCAEHTPLEDFFADDLPTQEYRSPQPSTWPVNKNEGVTIDERRQLDRHAGLALPSQDSVFPFGERSRRFRWLRTVGLLMVIGPLALLPAQSCHCAPAERAESSTVAICGK